jgi:hypothetical protein
MLALDDVALARLVIGATRVRASERSRWLQDLVRKLDPPSRPLTRQARWRARQRDGCAIYRIALNVERVINALIEGELTAFALIPMESAQVGG